MLTPPAALNALLFASGKPLEKKQARALLDLTEGEFAAVIEAADKMLEGSGLGLIETESELELRTSPDASPLVKKLRESELSRDLGKASLETLAVIAYQDSATRGEIDWVRGVNSTASIRTLLLRGLIEGREDAADKRRLRYSLTTEALAHLGIGRREDLPRASELSPATAAVITEAATASEE